MAGLIHGIPARHRRPPAPGNPTEGEPGPPQAWPTTHAAPDPFTTCQPDDGMTVSRPTGTTAPARHASGKNAPPLAGRPDEPADRPRPRFPDRPGRLRIRDRLRRAVQEMNSAPRSPALPILAFSRYYSAGPGPVLTWPLSPSQGRVPPRRSAVRKRPSEPPERETPSRSFASGATSLRPGDRTSRKDRADGLEALPRCGAGTAGSARSTPANPELLSRLGTRGRDLHFEQCSRSHRWAPRWLLSTRRS